MRAGSIAIAVALAAAGCKRADQAPPPPPPPEQPALPPPKPAARPTRAPTFVTLDEVRAVAPALTGVRAVAELALDASGKQALATVCVTSADAAATAQAIAAQYAAAKWQGPPPPKNAFAADYPIHDGTLHVQGQVRTLPACAAGELTVELSYTKMVPLVSPGAPGASTDRLAPTP